MIGQPLPYVLHTRHILLVVGQVLDDHGHAGVLGFSSKFVIMVEVVDGDSMWTNVVEGMTAYSPEELKTMLIDAGFIQTEIHRMKPSNATIIGIKA